MLFKFLFSYLPLRNFVNYRNIRLIKEQNEVFMDPNSGISAFSNQMDVEQFAPNEMESAHHLKKFKPGVEDRPPSGSVIFNEMIADNWGFITNTLTQHPQALNWLGFYSVDLWVHAYRELDKIWDTVESYFVQEQLKVKFKDEESILQIIHNFSHCIPPRFQKHLMTNVIREQRWAFVKKILEFDSQALMNSGYFNGGIPSFTRLDQMTVQWGVKPEDESLILTMINDFPKSFPANFPAHLTICAITQSRWNFVHTILQKYPQAIIETNFFGQFPQAHDIFGKPIKWNVNAEDESLLSGMLDDFPSSFPSDFVPHFMCNMISQSRWEVVQTILKTRPDANLHMVKNQHWITSYAEDFSPGLEIFQSIFKDMQEKTPETFITQLSSFCYIAKKLNSIPFFETIFRLPSGMGLGPALDSLGGNYIGAKALPLLHKILNEFPTEALEKHAETLLKLTTSCDEPAAIPNILKRFPKMNLKSFFIRATTNKIEEYLQLAIEDYFVKQIMGDNIHYLLEWCAKSTIHFLNTHVEHNAKQFPFEPHILKKILEVYPESDLAEYTEIVFKRQRGSSIARNKEFKEIFSILLNHATTYQSTLYLGKYGDRLKVLAF